MIQGIFFKFLRFLPVLMIIICGFGFTYWMLLQNQTVFATPVEALIRTALMTFDLGYDSRIYGTPDQPAHYKLVYVIIILTAIVFSVFIINLLIGKITLPVHFFGYEYCSTPEDFSHEEVSRNNTLFTCLPTKYELRPNIDSSPG